MDLLLCNLCNLLTFIFSQQKTQIFTKDLDECFRHRFRYRFRYRYRYHFRFRYRYRYRFRFRFSLSPIQELEPGATPCRGGRCAARYPLGPPAASKQKYFRL